MLVGCLFPLVMVAALVLLRRKTAGGKRDPQD